MKRLAFLLMLTIPLLHLSCDKDDDEEDNPAPTNNYAVIQGEEGSSLLLTIGDDETEIGSDRIFGWEGGNLLNMNYFRQIRIYTSDHGAMAFRINIPRDTSSVDVIAGTHSLQPKLLLQDTGNLTEVIYTLYFTNDDELDYAQSGTITITENVTAQGETYDIFGEIDADIVLKSGGTATLEGSFWAKDLD